MNALKKYSTLNTEKGTLYSKSICTWAEERLWRTKALNELKELLRPQLSLATIRLILEKIPNNVIANEYEYAYDLYLNVCREEKMAKEQLILNDTFWSNDRGNDYNYEGITETGQILFGEATFGEFFSREYYSNGNPDRDESSEEKTLPKFSSDQPLIALIKKERETDDDEETTYRLFIYIPQ